MCLQKSHIKAVIRLMNQSQLRWETSDWFLHTDTHNKPLLALNHLTLVADGRFHPSIYSAFIHTQGVGDTRLITLLVHVSVSRLKNEAGYICASRHDEWHQRPCASMESWFRAVRPACSGAEGWDGDSLLSRIGWLSSASAPLHTSTGQCEITSGPLCCNWGRV